MKILNDKVQGFVTSDSFVKITDSNGKIFYEKENKKGNIHFNLPTGIYFSENKLIPVNPYVHKLVPLPKPEKTNPVLPDKIKIVITDNPHKCSIIPKKNLILLDRKIAKLPKYVLMFILGHELGHYFYYTEKFCDAFARNMMLKNGYNYSQTTLAPFTTLTSCERLKNILNLNEHGKE